MFSELGHLALVLAFGVAVVQMVVPMIGAQKNWGDWMAIAVPAAILQFFLIAQAFAALTHAFVTNDFSVALVADHSNSAMPLLYKITGTWGNHEGSMLLWVLILTIFGAMVAWRGANLPAGLKARVLSVQAGIAVAFIAFLLFTSNPFVRLENPPFDGADLNPLLQDPGLAFHPPFLYLGYVGLSMAFSFAIAALIEGRVDAAWARWVRPWTLAAWVFLTIGIALGSWWAYYELGWGGWWFWDPVENASFMPWLIATALLHSAIVVEKRDTLKSWTVLLAILAFSFSLIGTFIVRSGVITSVHAFANDPLRGQFILYILGITIGGSLLLYAVQAQKLRSKSTFAMVSRESGLLLNNLLLVVATMVVFVGTVWPLLAEITTGRKLSVGPPFFEVAFTPFMVIIAMVLPIAAIVPWKRASLAKSMQPLWGVLALSVAFGALVWTMQTGGRMLAPIGITLAAWVLLGALADFGQRIKFGQAAVAESLRRAGNLPRADWGKAVAHGGLGVMIFGVSAITAWEVEDLRVMKFGESADIGGYTIRLDGVTQTQGPNYRSETGQIMLLKDGSELGLMLPEKRFYPVQRMPTTEAAIDQGITRDVYVVLGDQQENGGWAVRTFIKPYANWLWGGALLMALGGVLSLTDRRYRVGAPQRGRMVAVPAE